MNERLWRMRRALEVVTERREMATAIIDAKLRNPLNGSGGATRAARFAGAARRRAERLVGERLACLLTLGRSHPTRSVVLLTRISPKAFDDDNLAAALKSVRDGIATAWGIDDGSDEVVWLYDSEKGAPRQHRVRASLWALPVVQSDDEVDASDYERPRVVVHGGLIQRRELRATPAVIRARGGA